MQYLYINKSVGHRNADFYTRLKNVWNAFLQRKKYCDELKQDEENESLS